MKPLRSAQRTPALLLAAGAWLASCSPDAGSTQRLAPGDAALYAAYVQPYLERSCATLDCHGSAGRPLRLYSELGLRRDPTLRTVAISEHSEPSALTPRELADNQRALAAVALASGSPETHLALKKPLALRAGGIAHEGGVHWTSRDDPGYLCLRAYLVGDRADDAATSCARALDAVTR